MGKSKSRSGHCNSPSDAGYLLRYRRDATAQNVPHWNHLRVMRFNASNAALVFKHPMLPVDAYPELPKTFPDYASAFAFAVELLRRGTARLSADKERTPDELDGLIR